MTLIRRCEMREAGKFLLVVLAVLALSAVVSWIAGPEAGGTAMLMISIGLAAYLLLDGAATTPQKSRGTARS